MASILFFKSYKSYCTEVLGLPIIAYVDNNNDIIKSYTTEDSRGILKPEPVGQTDNCFFFSFSKIKPVNNKRFNIKLM